MSNQENEVFVPAEEAIPSHVEEVVNSKVTNEQEMQELLAKLPDVDFRFFTFHSGMTVGANVIREEKTFYEVDCIVFADYKDQQIEMAVLYEPVLVKYKTQKIMKKDLLFDAQEATEIASNHYKAYSDFYRNWDKYYDIELKKQQKTKDA